MGVLADSVLAHGGRAIGVMPAHLVAKEIAHMGLTELRVVNSMHERKAALEELADAFVALPGGCGTFEEFCDMFTWGQLGLHRKPCGLLNVDRFYASDYGLVMRMCTILADAYIDAAVASAGRSARLLVESRSTPIRRR